jgi:hypothetical protein
MEMMSQIHLEMRVKVRIVMMKIGLDPQSTARRGSVPHDTPQIPK